MIFSNEKYRCVFAGLIIGFVIFYAPYITLNPLATPDETKLFVVGVDREPFFFAFDTVHWVAVGRSIGALVANIQLQFIDEVSDLRYARLFNVFFLSVICFSFFLYFEKFISTIQALVISVSICLLPAFILGVIWAFSFAFFLVAPLIAFFAGALIIVEGSKSLVRFSRIFGVILFLISLFMYQPSAMFFFVPLGFKILFDSNMQSIHIRSKFILILVTFIVISCMYFAVQRYIILPAITSIAPSDPLHSSDLRWRIVGTEPNVSWGHAFAVKAHLVVNLTAKILQPWSLFMSYESHASWAFWFSVSIIVAGVIFGHTFSDAKNSHKLRVLSRLDVLLFVLLTILSLVPDIVSAGGSETVRTIGASSTFIILSLFWSIARLNNRWPVLTASPKLLLFAALLVAVSLMSTILSAGLMAKSRYDAVQSQIVNTTFPIATVKNLFPYIYGTNELGIPRGHELSATTVDKELANIVLASLGYSEKFKYLETSGDNPEIGVAPGDVLIDHRYQMSNPLFTFSEFDRIVYKAAPLSKKQACDPFVDGFNVEIPSMSEWSVDSLRVEKLNHSLDMTSVIVRSLGSTPTQRLSHRIAINAPKSSTIRAQFSVRPSAGVKLVGFRISARPHHSESFFGSAPVTPGIWNCVSFSHQILKDVSEGDVFIYPISSSNDRNNQPGLATEISQLSLNTKSYQSAARRPLRKIWRIESSYDSYENGNRLANMVDATPFTFWINNSKDFVDMIIKLPERKGVLRGIRLKGDASSGNPLPLPSSVKIYGLAADGKWDALSGQLIINQNQSELKAVDLPVAYVKFYKIIKLIFTPSEKLPWAIDEIEPNWEWEGWDEPGMLLPAHFSIW